MKLIGVVFTRLGGISRLAFVYRLPDGSIKMKEIKNEIKNTQTMD